MKVCIPAEINTDELRVAATPKTVLRLIKQGFEVFVEKDAGLKANFSNKEFTDSGATVLGTAKEIYATGDIILKVLSFMHSPVEWLICTSGMLNA